MSAWVGLAFGGLVLAGPVGQAADRRPVEVEVGVEPATVTVGEPFTAAVRIRAPSGVRVEFGPFAGGDTLQAIDAPRPLPESAPGRAAAYRLVAWIAGVPLSATIPVRLVEPSGEARIHLVGLQLPEVASVLPADAENVAPRPAKPLVSAGTGTESGLPWWYWLVAIVGALGAAALAVHRLWSRDTDRGTPIAPRDWALRQLAEIEAAASPDATLTVYRRASWVLRVYLERVDPRFRLDLSSTEIVGVMEVAGADSAPRTELRDLLRAADLAKFSGVAMPVSVAETWLVAVRRWIERFPPGSAGAGDGSERAA